MGQNTHPWRKLQWSLPRQPLCLPSCLVTEVGPSPRLLSLCLHWEAILPPLVFWDSKFCYPSWELAFSSHLFLTTNSQVAFFCGDWVLVMNATSFFTFIARETFRLWLTFTNKTSCCLSDQWCPHKQQNMTFPIKFTNQ